MVGTSNSILHFLTPGLRRPSISPNRDARPSPVSSVGAHEVIGLSKLAFVSLWLLVFAIPWEDALTIADLGTAARGVGLIAVGLGILAIIDGGKLRRPVLGHFLMALFVTLASLSYLWSLYPEGTLTQVFTYIQLLTMVWLIWELAACFHEQIRLMQAYVFGTFVSQIDTVYQFISHQESAYERYAGARLNANDLGLMMALSIPFSYYLLIQSRGKVAWVYRLHLVLAGTTILLTASRGAALASVVALAIVPLTHARLTPRRKIALFLTAMLLVSGALFFVPSSSWERLSTVPNQLEHGTLTGRTLIWTAGWELFREHPFVGVGSNAFRVVVSRVLAEPIRLEETSPAPPAHNTFLSVLVEQGVLGFTAFCALLASLVLSLRPMPALSRKLWIVCLTAWAVGVSSLTWEMRKPTWFFFGLLMAQAAVWAKSSGTPRFSPLERRAHYPAARPLQEAISSVTS